MLISHEIINFYAQLFQPGATLKLCMTSREERLKCGIFVLMGL